MPLFWIILLSVIAVPSFVLAAAGAKGRPSLLLIFLCAIGIVIPILVFFLSACLTPDCKGASRNGWIDCFFAGKLALTPLVFWGAWGLFDFQISNTSPVRKSAAQGLVVGALVSCICLGLGMVTIFSSPPPNEMAPWLLIPLFVAVWYSVAAINAAPAAKLKPFDYLIALCASIPFWLGSILWSQSCYKELPNAAPGCFVVTAASRGHRRIVGPFFPAVRRGSLRTVNQQLLTFWRFEAAWRTHLPLAHATFRKIYNRIGPVIAKRICSPWLADAAYLTLKPAEFICRALVNIDALDDDLSRKQKEEAMSCTTPNVS